MKISNWKALLLFPFLPMACLAQQPLATFDRANGSGPTLTGNAQHIQSIGFSRGPGLVQSSGGDFNSRSWDEADLPSARANENYLSWSITVDSGYEASLGQLQIRIDVSSTGPDQILIYASTDAFNQSWVALEDSTLTAKSNGANYALSLDSLTLRDGASVDFRLYAWGASSSVGTLDIEGAASLASNGIGDAGAQITGQSRALYTFDGQWRPSNPSGVVTADEHIRISSGRATLSSSSCKSLYIAAGAALQLNGDSLSCDSALLAASSSAYAQLKGKVLGRVYWQRQLSATASAAWFNCSFPLMGTLSSIDFDSGGVLRADGSANSNVYTYDATAVGPGDGEGDWTAVPSAAQSTHGTAYSMYLGAPNFGTLPMRLTASGSLNYTPIYIGIEPQASNPPTNGGYGWNYVPNPFSATLDWHSVVANNPNISTTYWVLNTSGSWMAYNAAAPLVQPGSSGAGPGAQGICSRYIAPGQAFFIQSSSASSLNLDTADLRLGEQPVLQKTGGMPNSILLRLQSDVDSLSDWTFLAFEAGEDAKNDRRKDALKRRAADVFLASTNGADDFLYNFSEPIDRARIIDLRFGAEMLARYRLHCDTTFLGAGIEVWLEDHHNGALWPLHQTDYSFEHVDKADSNRFNLHLYPSQLHQIEAEGKELIIRFSSEELDISPASQEDWSFKLWNGGGQLVYESQLESGAIRYNWSHLASGLYIVEYRDVAGSHRRKILKP